MIVTIRTTEGAREVPAETIGDELLAVHRTLHGNRDEGAPEWTLSHVPTGRAIVHLASRDDCLAIGRTLLETLDTPTLKAWRSCAPDAVEVRTPKRVAAWLERCHHAGRFVAPETAGA